MKTSVRHPVYGLISYEESIWTGKKSIQIGDVPLEKGKNKKTFLWNQNGNVQQVTVTGNCLGSVLLNIGQEQITLLTKPTWYEYLLSAIPLILIMIWSNSIALCSIIPVIGGAIGGAIAGLGFLFSVLQMRSKSISGKLLTAFITTAVIFAICAALGYLLVYAIYCAG